MLPGTRQFNESFISKKAKPFEGFFKRFFLSPTDNYNFISNSMTCLNKNKGKNSKDCKPTLLFKNVCFERGKMWLLLNRVYCVFQQVLLLWEKRERERERFCSIAHVKNSWLSGSDVCLACLRLVWFVLKYISACVCMSIFKIVVVFSIRWLFIQSDKSHKI